MMNIYPRLVSREYYETCLSSAVSMDFLDLKIVFTFDTEVARVYVTDDILQQLEMSVEELYKDALHNLNADGYKIIKLDDFINQALGIGNTFTPCGLKLYICTNTRFDNAAAILNANLLHDFATDHDVSDIIIIPSSKNEVLLIPANTIDFDFDELKNIIIDINSNILKPDDILSDHPYYYNVHSRLWKWKN